MDGNGRTLLRLSFLIGGVADAAVAVNWFLIAAGVEMPNLLCGMQADSEAYRFAMYIAGLFVTGWSILLFWGWFDPFARRDLLILTAALLLLSVAAELVLYRDLLGGAGFAFGIGARLALVTKFSASWFLSQGAGQ